MPAILHKKSAKVGQENLENRPKKCLKLQFLNLVATLREIVYCQVHEKVYSETEIFSSDPKAMSLKH